MSITYAQSCGFVWLAKSEMTNLSHLEGETVSILADGEVLEQQVVIDGTVSFDNLYSQIHVGLPYVSDIETLNVEIPMKRGTSQCHKIKIGNVLFRLVDSRGGWVGGNDEEIYEAFPNAIETKAGDNLDLFTGDLRVPLGDSYKGGGRLFFRQYDPLPITISAIVPEVSVGGPAL